MEIITIDCRRMTSPEEAHRCLAETLRFPAHYGANLDALADCLSELGPRVCVVLANAWAMRAFLGDYSDKLLKVFRFASEQGAFSLVVRGE